MTQIEVQERLAKIHALTEEIKTVRTGIPDLALISMHSTGVPEAQFKTAEALVAAGGEVITSAPFKYDGRWKVVSRATIAGIACYALHDAAAPHVEAAPAVEAAGTQEVTV